MMSKQIIASKIRQLINQACQFRYHKNISREKILQIDQNTDISNLSELFNTQLDIHVENQFQINFIYKYKLPQTRVFITELDTSHFQIQSIKYFDTTLYIVENFNKKSELKISINPEVIKFVPFPHRISNKLLVKDYQLLLITDSNSINSLEDIYSWLNSVLQNERANHPLTFVKLFDADLLVEIDNLWAKISGVNSDKKIENISVKRDFYLFWLQELYLTLGWFEELAEFHKNLSSNDRTDPKIKEVFKKRYEAVTQHAGIKSEIHKASGFFDLYISQNSNQNLTIKSQIQKHWETIALPIYSLQLKRDIRNNPDEYIAFALMALGYRFWWFDNLNLVMKDTLPDEMGNLYQLMVRIKQNINISCKGNQISIVSPVKINYFNSQRYIGKGIEANYTTSNNKDYSSLTFITKTCKVDKPVDFEVDPERQSLKILPIITTPPACEVNFDSIQIEIYNTLFVIPLAWKQFFVSINRCRFKFIFKKNRFQITIRLPKNVAQLKIEGQTYRIDDSRIRTVYYYPPKDAGMMNFGIFSSEGIGFSKLQSDTTKYKLCGIALDKYGIVVPSVNVSLNDSKRSFAVALADKQNVGIPIGKNIKTATIRAKKCEPRSISLDSKNTLLKRLLQIPAAVQKFNLVLYNDGLNTAFFNTIRRSISTNIGIMPQIGEIGQISKNNAEVQCIVGDNCSWTVLEDYGDFKVIKLVERYKTYCYWIHQNAAADFLSYHFLQYLTTALSSK